MLVSKPGKIQLNPQFGKTGFHQLSQRVFAKICMNTLVTHPVHKKQTYIYADYLHLLQIHL